jgi:hypothetical protein
VALFLVIARGIWGVKWGDTSVRHVMKANNALKESGAIVMNRTVQNQGRVDVDMTQVRLLRRKYSHGSTSLPPTLTYARLNLGIWRQAA